MFPIDCDSFMLGQNDIDDWTTSEEDRLRAEIRLLKVVQAYRASPGVAGRRLGRSLAGRLARFQRDACLLAGTSALLEDRRAEIVGLTGFATRNRKPDRRRS